MSMPQVKGPRDVLRYGGEGEAMSVQVKHVSAPGQVQKFILQVCRDWDGCTTWGMRCSVVLISASGRQSNTTASTFSSGSSLMRVRTLYGLPPRLPSARFSITDSSVYHARIWFQIWLFIILLIANYKSVRMQPLDRPLSMCPRRTSAA